MRLSLAIFRCAFLFVVAFALVNLWKPLNHVVLKLEELNYDAPQFNASLFSNKQYRSGQQVPTDVEKSGKPNVDRKNGETPEASGADPATVSSGSNTFAGGMNLSVWLAPNARIDGMQPNFSSRIPLTPGKSELSQRRGRIKGETVPATPSKSAHSPSTALIKGVKTSITRPSISVPLPSTALIEKEKSSRWKVERTIFAKLDGQVYTKEELVFLVESMSTTFSAWNQSKAYSWCHTRNSMNDGLLYVKLPKCASSTASGVALRIADTLGRRVLGDRKKCFSRYTHAIASNNLRLYGSRNQTTSFMWSIVREPNKRLLSSYFFDQVSRQDVKPTEEGILSFLRKRSDLKKSFQLRYLKLVRVNKKGPILLRQIMSNYNFIGLADRMDESLVILSMIMQIPLADVVLLSSKTAGGYDAGRSGKGCVKLVSTRKFDGVDRLLDSQEWRTDNWDQLFIQVVNRTLDKTIEHFGRDKVTQKLKTFRRLSEQVHRSCLSKAIFPCPETLPNHASLSEKSCYFADSGCGYECINKMLRNSSNVQWLKIQNQFDDTKSTPLLDKLRVTTITGKSEQVGTIVPMISTQAQQNREETTSSNRIASLTPPKQVTTMRGKNERITSNDRTYSPASLHATTTGPQQVKSPFPDWFQSYLQFHRDSIEDGRMKDGVPFLVYQCYGGCAGLGGRIKAMIKSFYAAVCSKRVFLIDSPFPFPLDEYLTPNMIQWNASFPNNTIQVPIFVRMGVRKNNLTVPPHDQVGVRITKAHGKNILDLNQILRTQVCVAYSKRKTDKLRGNEQQLYHWGSQVLFQFSDQVKVRGNELKRNATLFSAAPYVGLHVRSGAGATWKEDADRLRKTRQGGHDSFVQCGRLFRDIHGFSQAYVAADSVEPRTYLHQMDPFMLKTAEVETFHIDKSLSKKATAGMADFRGTWENNHGTASMDTARLGTLDLFAEFKILVEAECLIMSRSSLSYAAHFMAPQPHCGMLVDDCANETVAQRIVNYRLTINLFKIDS